MTMISMKITEEEKKNDAQRSVIEDNAQYPYGLIVNIDPKSAAKLGVTEPPKAGQKMMMLAEVEVKSVTVDEKVEGKKKCSFTLQITEMALKDYEEEEEEKSASSVLYGE